MKPGRRQQGKGALELLEEATHLLRTAPVAALASYFLGAVPFVLGLLFYWADMSRSPFARQHLADASLAMAGLFLWMKFWQVIFARSLRCQLSGQAPAGLGLRGVARIILTQAILQPSGLFLIPLSLVPALPFAWVYAFYQNATALADGEEGTASLFKRSWRQAWLWPKQNNLALMLAFGFGAYVFLNWVALCYFLPQLLKMLFGVQSIFTKSPMSMLNTTFFAAMFGLTYLAVDPLLKSMYVLRCFYGEALESGEDLKAELRPYVVAAQRAAAAVLVAGVLSVSFRVAVQPVGLKESSRGSKRSEDPRIDVKMRSHPEGVPENLLRADALVGTNSGTPSGCSFILAGYRRSSLCCDLRLLSGNPSGCTTLNTSRRPRSYAWAEQFALFATATVEEPSGSGAGDEQLSAPELDRVINQTIHERKYTWRMPRGKTQETDESDSLLGRFFGRIGDLLRKWVKAVLHWLREWWRKLFPTRKPTVHDSGNQWIMVEQLLLWGLIAAVVAALVLLFYRVWRQRSKGAKVIAGEAIFPVPDVADENVGAEQLPEDGWLKLGRELLQKGECRLAMRAFYLASLAHLAGRNLVRLARFKSNRDYELELRRRAHSIPVLLAAFGDNVSVFERIWYGTHEASLELVNQFASNVERLRGNI